MIIIIRFHVICKHLKDEIISVVVPLVMSIERLVYLNKVKGFFMFKIFK